MRMHHSSTPRNFLNASVCKTLREKGHSLLAALSVIALSCATFVNYANADTVLGALCDSSEELHMNIDTSGTLDSKDQHVATYVGKDMVIGNLENTNWYSATGPNGSYAAEAEGTTLVSGDLIANPLKGFFTFGIVAFGSQSLPDDGSTILAVGGKTNTLSRNAQASDGPVTHVQAWNAGMGIKTGDSQGNNNHLFNAFVAGPSTDVWGKKGTPSLRQYTAKNGPLTFNDANPLSHVVLAGKTQDLTNADDEVITLSTSLKDLTANGFVTTGIAPAEDVTYYKYNYSSADGVKEPKISYALHFDGPQNPANAEKVLYLTGDGASKLQVFSLTADQLNSDGYRGLDLSFSNIPENASVVLNVRGKNISWHNGWRVWWDGTQIGNGYSDSVPSAIQDLYAQVGQKLLWNFVDADNLTIYGGKTTNASANNGLTSSDDPAAALLGSVIVPHGNFDDHVTTNGRVWVTGNYLMNTPTPASQKVGGVVSASVLDMDEERHVLPWSGAVTNTCSSIEWRKTDDSGIQLLPGSSWNIYTTRESAESNGTALLSVTDNGENDWSSEQGHLLVQGLRPNATYFVKETTAPEGYLVNTNIYEVTTTLTGNDVNEVPGDAVSADGFHYIADQENHVSWYKADADNHAKLLAGATWKVTNTTTGEEWTVTDSTRTISSVSATIDDKQGKVGATTHAHASVEGQNHELLPDEPISWVSSDTNVAVVEPDGTVHAIAPGMATLTARAGDKKAVVMYNVLGDGPVKVDPDVMCIDGSKFMLPGTTQQMLFHWTDGYTDPSVAKWSSSDPQIASVNQNGEVTAISEGMVIITAEYNNYTTQLAIQVGNPAQDSQPENQVTLYYQKSRTNWPSYYIHYTTDGTTWTTQAQPMQEACAGWVSYTIEKPASIGYAVFTDTPGLKDGHWDNNGSSKGSYTIDPTWPVSVLSQGSNTITHTNPCSAAVESIEITSDKLVNGEIGLYSGQVISLGHKVSPDSVSNIQVTWKSSDPTVATVNYAGNVVAKTPGQTTISATAGKKSASILVTVQHPPSKGIRITGSTMMFVGQNQMMGAVKNGSPLQGASWTSSDTAVATVDPQTGAVHAVAPGITTITVTAANGTQGTILCVISGLPVLADMNAQPGHVSVAGLQDGDYTVEETLAPNGYALSSTPRRFSIINGQLSVTDAGDTSGADSSVLADNNNSPIAFLDTPTSVSWNKVSGTDNSLLAGSTWSITKYTDSSYTTVDSKSGFGNQGVLSVTKSSGEPGNFRVTGLLNGFYRLSETQAPTGYELAAKPTDFEINNAQEKLTNIVLGNLKNSEKPGSATWKKSDDKGTLLPGSHWKLTMKRSYTDAATGVTHHELLMWNVVDATGRGSEPGSQSGSGSGSASAHACEAVAPETSSDKHDGEVSVTTSKEGVLCDEDERDGIFSVTGLPWGNYTLEETQAPEGYLASSETFSLDVTTHTSAHIGVSTALAADATTSAAGSATDKASADSSDKAAAETSSYSAHIDFGSITNTKKWYVLPQTGSLPGQAIAVVVAVILLILGAWLYSDLSPKLGKGRN